MGVWILDFMFATPKRYILGRNRIFWRILRQNPSRALGCSEFQGPPPPPKKKTNTSWRAVTHARRRNAWAMIVTNFCTGVGVHDVITCADLYFIVSIVLSLYRLCTLSCTFFMHVWCVNLIKYEYEYEYEYDRLRGMGGGSYFGFLHWHASSPLQHSRTTVRVCDKVRGDQLIMTQV